MRHTEKEKEKKKKKKTKKKKTAKRKKKKNKSTSTVTIDDEPQTNIFETDNKTEEDTTYIYLNQITSDKDIPMGIFVRFEND